MNGHFHIGWQLMILGMGIVFFMLYLLSAILGVMGKYFGPKVSKIQEYVPVMTEPVQAAENKNVPVAAIMAAVQVVMGDTDFRIISVKRTDSSTWKQTNNVSGAESNYRARKGN